MLNLDFWIRRNHVSNAWPLASRADRAAQCFVTW